jgi:hypothetical protein
MVAEGSQRPVDDLESRAQACFAPLSQAELKLLRAAPKGEVAWCGPSDKDDDPANDPAKADEWGPEREIKAKLIRWLCKDRDAASAVDPKGIQVHGARITGALNLAFVSVPFPLGLCRCCFTHNANLISTDLPALNLAGSRVLSVAADRANVKGGVFLSNAFNAQGEVRLLGAQIGSNLECSGGTFKNPGKDALSADGAHVKGDAFLRDGFSAEGEVRLLGAQIGGVLDCSEGTFKNPGKDALSADGANVEGGVFLSGDFSAEGEVRLLGVEIGANLDCSGGAFKNPGGRALSADHAGVEGGVFLSDGFSAEGEVRLPGARIEGDLDCSRGKFGDLNVETAAIVGALFWRSVEATEATWLNLTNASAGSLIDDEKSWPGKGNLLLDGFIYGHISGNSPSDAKTRLTWLALQPEFKPQPYNQLAKVLREAGHAKGARRVLYEMETRRRKAEDQGLFSRLISRAFKITLGYGYYPQRIAVGGLVFLITMGWWFFRQGYFAGAIVPTDRDAYYSFRTHGRPPEHYQRFTASVYSLENSLPFVNLGQKDQWTPDPNPQASRWVPGFLRWFRWGQVLLGWLLATLFVAGVTGVVRKE